MFARRLGALLLFGVTCAASAHAQDLKPEALYQKVLPSIMTLSVDGSDGKKVLGTAFLAIKDGLAVTAWHVVNGAAKVTARFADGEEFECSGLVDKDEKRDIAIIRVKVAGRPLLSMERDDPAVGSRAYVVGAPEGLQFSISDGLVSQVQQFEGMNNYQYTCPTSHGNSGGPLMNDKGSVIGVVSWGLKEGQNLNFAIPSLYVLGLDASLNTVEWKSVRASPKTSNEATVSFKDFDKVIFNGLEANTNLAIAWEVGIADIVRKKGGYRSGAPIWMYTRERNGRLVLDKLRQLTTNNEIREKVRKGLIDKLVNQTDAATMMIKAINTAQEDKGWSKEAGDYMRRSSAARMSSATGDDMMNLVNFLALGPEVQDLCPEGLKPHMALAKRSDLPFGIYRFTDLDPQFVMIVAEKSHAQKIGLRNGDFIKELDGKPVDSVNAFLLAIEEFQGKRVKVTVSRNFKLVTWEANVPKDLHVPGK